MVKYVQREGDAQKLFREMQAEYLALRETVEVVEDGKKQNKIGGMPFHFEGGDIKFNPHPFVEQETKSMAVGSVLDLGVGVGSDTLYFAKRGCHVTAVDVLPKCLSFTEKWAHDKRLAIPGKVTPVRASITRDPLRIFGDVPLFEFQEDYDVLLIMGVLQYVRDEREVSHLFSRMKDHTNLGGVQFIGVPLIEQENEERYRGTGKRLYSPGEVEALFDNAPSNNAFKTEERPYVVDGKDRLTLIARRIR